jgi:hypothetical protein
MWGSSIRLGVETNGFTIGQIGGQIARVNYRRPETWSFWLAARLLEGTTVPVNTTLDVDIIIIAGVGRAKL